MQAVAPPPSGARRFGGLINDQNYMWWAALPIIMGMFIVIMDSSIVNVAISHIMNDFGSNIDDIEWVSTGYMLSAAIMMPTTGFLSERFGAKNLYVIAIALFTVASMLCGAAWDTGSLVFFRVLQGIVGGAIQPVAQAIVFQTFPPEKRGVSQALVGIGAMMAPMIGPTVGGYLVDYLSWRWIFYVNLIPGIVATLLAWAILRPNLTKKVDFDVWGFSLMATFLTTALLALSQGNSKGWGTPYIIGLFAVAFVTFGLFLIVALWRRHPVVYLDLFKFRTYAMGNVASVIMGIGLFGGMFLLPVFLQTLMGYDAIKAGLLMFPQGLMAGLMMVSSGLLFSRFDPRVPMVAGLGLVGASLIFQSHITLDSSTWDVVWPTMLRGMGMGLAFPSLNQTALAAIPIKRVGQASGLFNVTRQLGGSVGIAGLTTFLTMRTVFHQDVLGEAAAGNGVATQTIGQVAHDLISQGANPLVASQQAGAIVMGHLTQQVMVTAYQDTFWIAGIVMFLGLVPVLFMKRTPHTSGGDAGHMAVME